VIDSAVCRRTSSTNDSNSLTGDQYNALDEFSMLYTDVTTYRLSCIRARNALLA